MNIIVWWGVQYLIKMHIPDLHLHHHSIEEVQIETIVVCLTDTYVTDSGILLVIS